MVLVTHQQRHVRRIQQPHSGNKVRGARLSDLWTLSYSNSLLLRKTQPKTMKTLATKIPEESNGELVVIPYSVEASGATLQISHSVLSGGRPVLAAGEGSILVRPSNTTVRLLNRHTGHFETSAESLEIGVKAFESRGINVLRIDPTIPR